MFYSGQKVICVDAADNPKWGPAPLTKGASYTVLREVGPDGIFIVEEVSASPAGFKRTRFRPATDISLLTELLTNPNKRIKTMRIPNNANLRRHN